MQRLPLKFMEDCMATMTGTGETALPCPALPCPALPCPALSCPALPCPALPCPALPCHFLPYLPSPAPPCPSLPCPALTCPALPCPDDHHFCRQVSLAPHDKRLFQRKLCMQTFEIKNMICIESDLTRLNKVLLSQKCNQCANLNFVSFC